MIVGKSLKTLVDKGWRFQEAEVTKIAQQVLEILNYLHSLKPAVIHRDIKPHNLIQTEAGDIYLVDFGAVQDVYRNTLTRGATFVGTIDYMPPEQIRGQTSIQSDLYSFGCTLLFLLTRRSPSELPISRMKLDFRQKLQLSNSFATWLDKILEPVPEDRFSSATEAITQLKEENLDYSEHLMPIRGSKIELKRNCQTLLIEIPTASVLDNNRFKSFIHMSLSFIFAFLLLGFLISRAGKTDSENIDGLIIIAIFFNAMFLVGSIQYNFRSTSLKIEKGIVHIRHQLCKFVREHKISTRHIERLRIKKEKTSHKNNNEIANYYVAIHDGKEEYTFGKYLNEIERNWLFEVIASHIEYFYPGTRLPSKNRYDIWFQRDLIK